MFSVTVNNIQICVAKNNLPYFTVKSQVHLTHTDFLCNKKVRQPKPRTENANSDSRQTNSAEKDFPVPTETEFAFLSNLLFISVQLNLHLLVLYFTPFKLKGYRMTVRVLFNKLLNRSHKRREPNPIRLETNILRTSPCFQPI